MHSGETHDFPARDDRISQRLLPYTAGVSAVSTLLSCLPLGVATAIGAVTVSAWLTPFRWWLVGLSTLLLVAGFAQLFRRPRSQRRIGTMLLLSVSVIFVLLVVGSHVVR